MRANGWRALATCAVLLAGLLQADAAEAGATRVLVTGVVVDAAGDAVAGAAVSSDVLGLVDRGVTDGDGRLRSRCGMSPRSRLIWCWCWLKHPGYRFGCRP